MAGVLTNPYGVQCGVFLKLGAYPPVETAVMDLDGGADGYARFTLSDTGTLRFVATLLRPADDIFTTPLPPGVWAWVSFAGLCDTSNSGAFRWEWGIWWGGAGQHSGNNFPGLAPPYYPPAQNCGFSLGMTLAGGPANAPNNSGIEFSKPYFNTTVGNKGVVAPPTSDWGAQAAGIYVYNCRQTVGTAPALDDNSGNAQNLAPGPLGLTINVDGPFL